MLVSDIRWLIRIGKWALGVMTATILLVIPLSVTFFVHISHITSEIDQIKIRMASNDKMIDKMISTQERFSDAVVKDIEKLFREHAKLDR